MEQSGKDQGVESNSHQANINIDINGDAADESAVKNMNLDANNEGRVGYSKEELMKFANQPFWVRLRNILFASFWILWLSILVVAVGYVIHTPGCKLVQATNLTATATTAATNGAST